jgi:hypothetical protein
MIAHASNWQAQSISSLITPLFFKLHTVSDKDTFRVHGYKCDLVWHERGVGFGRLAVHM